jgi:hypothetical protein
VGRLSGEGGRDWTAAYRLDRRWLSPRLLSLVAVAGGVAAAGALVAPERAPLFRPGAVSEAHASALGTAACDACHDPFAGPSEPACVECHRGQAVHQETQVSSPPCGGCHFEHRGLERLTLVGDDRCVLCHGDLEVRPGSARTFAASIRGFGDDHPELAVAVGGERLPLSDPAARGADLNPLAFGHARHLVPLAVPGGTVTLVCEDCHRPLPGGGGRDGRMQPIRFAEHCQGCHLLTFDPALRDEQAPHGSPALVRAHVLAAYAGDDRWRRMSFAERRRLIATRADGAGWRLDAGERRLAARAEAYLFQSACPVCHQLRLEGPLPEVAPVAVSRDWFPHARFPHDRHGVSQGLACTDCHAAPSSRETADVLLPGIETCRRCHGGGPAAAAADRERVPSRCVDCHDYHGASPPGAAALLRAATTADGGGAERGDPAGNGPAAGAPLSPGDR